MAERAWTETARRTFEGWGRGDEEELLTDAPDWDDDYLGPDLMMVAPVRVKAISAEEARYHGLTGRPQRLRVTVILDASTPRRSKMLKATITDSEALRAITPEMMKAYLQAHGWKLDAGDLWGRWRMGAEYIFAELDIFDDRAIRAAEALQTLAQIEDRSQLDIYCELVGKPTYEELERELDALRHQLSYGY